MTRLLFILFFTLPLFTACHNKTSQASGDNGAFAKAKSHSDGVNIDRISQSGELIIGTISGPDTYFDYQGRGMGLQYALAEDFANTLGVGVRVELATDSTELAKMLKKGDVDVIAYQLSPSFCQKEGIATAGTKNTKTGASWAILPDAKDLAEALNDWYGDGVEVKAQKTERTWLHNRTIVHRKVRAPFISREKGIISTYDAYFKAAARYTGWDWRLIAAQCYQESGFDPNATSWAGACGLMQIMPATAGQYGLPSTRLFSPEDNITTAARHIRHLQQQFANIADAEERAKFVLAAYNGGLGHIRDAQSLARKHGGNANNWSDVSYYVRNLSNAQYYRDPVVKYGYMIGSETYNYVISIMERWRQYGGNVHSLSSGRLPDDTPLTANSNERVTPHKRNRFSKAHKILSADEMEQLNQ